MSAKWKQILILFVSFVTTVVSGFLVVMHFHHDPHWRPDRFGGLPVALACIPICAASYVVGCYYVNRWLHPILFPRLRAMFPAPPGDRGRGRSK